MIKVDDKIHLKVAKITFKEDPKRVIRYGIDWLLRSGIPKKDPKIQFLNWIVQEVEEGRILIDTENVVLNSVRNEDGSWDLEDRILGKPLSL